MTLNLWWQFNIRQPLDFSTLPQVVNLSANSYKKVPAAAEQGTAYWIKLEPDQWIGTYFLFLSMICEVTRHTMTLKSHVWSCRHLWPRMDEVAHSKLQLLSDPAHGFLSFPENSRKSSYRVKDKVNKTSQKIINWWNLMSKAGLLVRAN